MACEVALSNKSLYTEKKQNKWNNKIKQNYCSTYVIASNRINNQNRTAENSNIKEQN